jgi:hypothetical protein
MAIELPATVFKESTLEADNEAFLKREEKFVQKHQNDTDEALLQYLRDCAAKLGYAPTKHEVVGFTYLKSRFGPWPRVLEKAGLKEVRNIKVRRR